MKSLVIIIFLTSTLIFGGLLVNLNQESGTNVVFAQSESEDEALALQLTGIFRAYRSTVAKKEDSIHKPSEYFTKENIDERVSTMHKTAKIYFKVATKTEYPEADDSEKGKLRKHMENAFEQVLRDYIDGKLDLKWTGDNAYIKKWDGKMLPARFASLASAKFNKMTDGKATIKLTTTNTLLVNKDNAPDNWESEVMDKNLLNTNQSSGKAQIKTEKSVYRYLLPEFYSSSCINCHGTGDGQEGFAIHPSKIERKIDDFAGGISIQFKK
jgi:hypothetical protein